MSYSKADKTLSLTIKDVQVNNNGIYSCEVNGMFPPPIDLSKGKEIHLRVHVPPVLQLSFSLSKEHQFTALVICIAYGFYPRAIQIVLTASCGDFQLLDRNGSLDSSRDGTYNMTKRSLVSIGNCSKGSEVTCVANYTAAQMNQTLWIPAEQDNKGTEKMLICGISFERFLCFGLFCLLCTAVCLLKERIWGVCKK
ncbi:uncharacterized protein LOC135358122 [Latimeria chalumnae]|uniref:uncharacterized protein LOC135358122 n=1 Tax=Latimeria chalumnae TaxID=7897 RepID=UPI00313D36C5